MTYDLRHSHKFEEIEEYARDHNEYGLGMRLQTLSPVGGVARSERGKNLVT